MQREIKFRGKRIDNGEWVYGGIWHPSYYNLNQMCIHDGVCGIAVQKDTVGQYTGLKDKNGKEIYEGDIISWGDKTCREKGNTEIVTVVWSGGAFCVQSKYGLHEFYHYSSHKWNEMPYASDGEGMNIAQYFRDAFEVIGNIYDNPELLTK